MSYRPRVLVIDDDPLFRSLVVSALRKDYIVAVANEGSEGFYKALEHLPDIAIVDIQMPGWDGLKTLKAFRGHPQLNCVKILMLTADASKETVLAAIHGGANDYVIKTSFSADELHNKLQKLQPGLLVRQSSDNNADAFSPSPHIGGAAAETAETEIAACGAPDEPLQLLIDDWE